jgi:hypothetical protein
MTDAEKDELLRQKNELHIQIVGEEAGIVYADELEKGTIAYAARLRQERRESIVEKANAAIALERRFLEEAKANQDKTGVAIYEESLASLQRLIHKYKV